MTRSTRSARRVRAYAGLAAVVAFALACSTPDPNARLSLKLPPGGNDFKPVGDFLVHRCGSLDCHGQVGRNFKIYGGDGLRLDANAVSGDVLNPTTDDEYRTTWASIADLEPEIMTSVVGSGGSQPDRLTFVRKMRGVEQHIGGKLVKEGDSQDQCITSWLSGSVDTGACTQAADPTVYP